MSVLTWEIADQLIAEQDQDIIIPEGHTSIVDYAFEDFGLLSVTIPDSVVTIGEHAFETNSLTSIVIPASVKTIGDNAFSGNLLTNVVIPDSVEKRLEKMHSKKTN